MASPSGQAVPLSLLPWPVHLGDHPNFPLPPTGPPEADVKAEPGVGARVVFPTPIVQPRTGLGFLRKCSPEGWHTRMLLK